ncbi:MAG: GNAT family N-acetyltransferase [Pseudoalteromonas spongiae]
MKDLCLFNSQRLTVSALKQTLNHVELNQLIAILSPEVTRYLPPSFHGITTPVDAKAWLSEQAHTSQIYGIYHNAELTLIGLLIIYEDNGHVHIGYLFNAQYWGKGYASELLKALIHYGRAKTQWRVIHGGVSIDNPASAHVLSKMGFTKTPSNTSDMLQFELAL